MSDETFCWCHDKDVNYENFDHLPTILGKNGQNEHWEILDFVRGEMIGDFTMHYWTAKCKKCFKFYLYTIGIDLESDWERVIRFREDIPSEPKSKL